MIPGVVIDHLLGESGLSAAELGIFQSTYVSQPTSMGELTALTGMSLKRVVRLCDRLVAAGWMKKVPHGNTVRPMGVIPHECQEKLASIFLHDYDLAGSKGEWLMKTLLDFYIASDVFVDNARPPFLKIPGKTAKLEYDRFYYPSWAWEFNGLQHDRTTREYPDEDMLTGQQYRDRLKIQLSKENGVRLTVITVADLPPSVFKQLIPGDMPRRIVDESGPYFQAVEQTCAAYRIWWRRHEDEVSEQSNR
jgi:hypothetical protein